MEVGRGAAAPTRGRAPRARRAQPDGHLPTCAGIAEFGAVGIMCLWSRVREFVTYITKPALTGPYLTTGFQRHLRTRILMTMRHAFMPHRLSPDCSSAGPHSFAFLCLWRTTCMSVSA